MLKVAKEFNVTGNTKKDICAKLRTKVKVKVNLKKKEAPTNAVDNIKEYKKGLYTSAFMTRLRSLKKTYFELKDNPQIDEFINKTFERYFRGLPEGKLMRTGTMDKGSGGLMTSVILYTHKGIKLQVLRKQRIGPWKKGLNKQVNKNQNFSAASRQVTNKSAEAAGKAAALFFSNYIFKNNITPRKKPKKKALLLGSGSKKKSVSAMIRNEYIRNMNNPSGPSNSNSKKKKIIAQLAEEYGKTIVQIQTILKRK